MQLHLTRALCMRHADEAEDLKRQVSICSYRKILISVFLLLSYEIDYSQLVIYTE